MDGDAHSKFAAHVREQLAAELKVADTPEWRRIRIQDVYPDSDAERPTVVVLFTDTSRPGCVFGARCSTDVVGVDPDDDDSLHLAASIFVTNIEEEVAAGNAGLPEDCAKGAVTWVLGAG